MVGQMTTRSVFSILVAGAAAAVVSAATSGCASSAPGADESTASDDLQAGAYTYFVASRDLRKCAAPACGGYFVSRANRPTTTCADGSSAAACYVADIDVSGVSVSASASSKALGLVGSDAGNPRVVFRGHVAKKSYGSKKLGVLDVTEIWVAPAQMASDASEPFYRIDDSGKRCAKAPCDTFEDKQLNAATHSTFATLDLTGAPGTATEQTRATAEASSSNGILAIGTLSSGTFSASQFFTQLADGKNAGDDCASDDECSGNLICCYPCGVQGCHNVCTVPNKSGTCPLMP
jgi:hypothetical protein